MQNDFNGDSMNRTEGVSSLNLSCARSFS
uniref:Uncharacterized protein n=1 Tax=Anguilla anguilla TaxID=7936 RepID=A0A0E9SJV5_ANGAN